MNWKFKNRTYSIHTTEVWVHEEGNPEDRVIFDAAPLMSLMCVILFVGNLLLKAKGVIA